MKKRRNDYKEPPIGKKFGKLTVVQELDESYFDKISSCRIPLLCKCECGGHTITDRWALESGHKTACEYCSPKRAKPIAASVRAIQKNNTTGYKGIDINNGKFRVRYYYKNQLIFNERYETFEEAVIVRKAIEKCFSKI